MLYANNLTLNLLIINELYFCHVLKKGNQKYFPTKKVNEWVNTIRGCKIELLDSVVLIKEDLKDHSLNETNTRTKFIDRVEENEKIRGNYFGSFYYNLYHSLSNKDEKLKNLITKIINLNGISSFVYLDYMISSFNENELNNNVIKLIIFNEIILPNLLRMDNCC